jgi:hypothetical protein
MSKKQLRRQKQNDDFRIITHYTWRTVRLLGLTYGINVELWEDNYLSIKVVVSDSTFIVLIQPLN